MLARAEVVAHELYVAPDGTVLPAYGQQVLLLRDSPTTGSSGAGTSCLSSRSGYRPLASDRVRTLRVRRGDRRRQAGALDDAPAFLSS